MDWLDGGEDLLTAQRERDKPRQSLKNNTAGVREREDENRTREAGNRDEVEGVAASILNLYRNGAVGFIDWLDHSVAISKPELLPRSAPYLAFFPPRKSVRRVSRSTVDSEPW